MKCLWPRRGGGSTRTQVTAKHEKLEFLRPNKIDTGFYFGIHREGPKTIILSTRMCYSKCHNVDIFFQLKELLMLMNGDILAISGHDTWDL